MIHRSDPRHSVILLSILFCSTIILSGCAPHNSVTLSKTDEVKIETTDPLIAFAEEYATLHQKVEEGFLPAEVLSRAAEIRSGLQQYLLKTESQLEILRLDLLHGDDYAARQAALQEMLALAAERERTKMAYLQRLQALNTVHSPGLERKRGGKFKDIEIEIGPENVDGERP